MAGSSAHRPRTASTGSKPQQQQHYDDSGPVDITARVHQKVSGPRLGHAVISTIMHNHPVSALLNLLCCSTVFCEHGIDGAMPTCNICMPSRAPPGLVAPTVRSSPSARHDGGGAPPAPAAAAAAAPPTAARFRRRQVGGGRRRGARKGPDCGGRQGRRAGRPQRQGAAQGRVHGSCYTYHT